MRHDERADVALRPTRTPRSPYRTGVVTPGPPDGAGTAHEATGRPDTPPHAPTAGDPSAPRRPGPDSGAVGPIYPLGTAGCAPEHPVRLSRPARPPWRPGRATTAVAGAPTVDVPSDGTRRAARVPGADRAGAPVSAGAEGAPARPRRLAEDVLRARRSPHDPGSVGARHRTSPGTGRGAARGLAGAGAAASPALDGAAAREGTAVPDGPRPRGEVEVPAGPVRLSGRLSLPAAPWAMVVVVRGAGRHGPREQRFADALRGRHLGALLLDLLAEEERTPHNVHDVVLLARRLHAASQWLRREISLPVAYFGTGTGAAAALEAAAGDDIRAVVSRSGRPDLAGPAALAALEAPTLLVVGGLDTRVLGRSRVAADWMHCEHRIAVVPGATHAFTEPGVLNTATALGLDWFTDRLLRPGPVTARPVTARPGAA
ncbi:phosphoribosyltransferase [Streptomyces sp. NPDC088766]|uniref:phosphoribosyltransferase n=1 Tax=Streptomyces sp. NPDC088766 TaxID=3365893 RepID=UPI00380A7320